MAVVVKDRTCRQCGAVFRGGPRAWYCPSCRSERQREQNRRHKAKGPDRPIGSTDICVVCGKPYIVNGSRQKYCPDCAYDAVRAVDRPSSRAWNQAHKDTYYPARNAKRNAQRAADPDPVREKERTYRQRRRDSKKS